jgi:hypothetical protein
VEAKTLRPRAQTTPEWLDALPDGIIRASPGLGRGRRDDRDDRGGGGDPSAFSLRSARRLI